MGGTDNKLRFAEADEGAVVDWVNNHPITIVETPSGRLYSVGGTGGAFRTIGQARAFAVALDTPHD